MIHRHISELKACSGNPRKIDDKKFKELKNSILSFPLMLEKRPIVATHEGVIDGNQRLKVLSYLASLSESALIDAILALKGHSTKQKKDLRLFWLKWLSDPTVAVIDADDLNEEQRKELMIKANVHSGVWDEDLLASWDREALADWGLDFDLSSFDADEQEATSTESEEDIEQEDSNTDSDIEEDTDDEEDSTIQPPPLLDILYPSDNDLEIPTLLLTEQAGRVILPLSPWGAESRRRTDVATYHFYVDDYRFEALWKDPTKLVLSGCQAIVEPNCSLHDQTPIAYGLQLIYKKRWLARYLQDCGIKVYVDLNVSYKFSDYNRLGVPKGYNAFATRGLTGCLESLKLDLKVAKEISGLEVPNMIVYGGGKEIQAFCQEHNLLYVTDYINAKK